VAYPWSRTNGSANGHGFTWTERSTFGVDDFAFDLARRLGGTLGGAEQITKPLEENEWLLRDGEG